MLGTLGEETLGWQVAVLVSRQSVGPLVLLLCGVVDVDVRRVVRRRDRAERQELRRERPDTLHVEIEAEAEEPLCRGVPVASADVGAGAL